MSVLEQLRSGSDSSFMQVVMFIVVLSFIFWYATPQGDRTNVVAEVNGTKIMSTEYNREFRNVQRYQENRLQRALSDEEQRQLGETVKDILVEREVLRQKAVELGVMVSDDEVAARIIDDPGNHDLDGNFDKTKFERNLKYSQLTRDEFDERLREELRRSKLQQLVQMGATVSEPVVRQAWRSANTKVDIEYAQVRLVNFMGDVQVTDEERAAWLAENEVLAQEQYDADFQLRYKHPEKVRVSMIRLEEREDGPRLDELRAKLQTVSDAIGEGADFAAMAREWSEDTTAFQGGDRGLRPVEQLDPKEVEVLEGLAVGSLSRVFVLNGSEVRLYRLEERQPAREDSFDDVKNEIADRMITQERLPTMAVAFAEEILADWQSSGSPPTDKLAAKNIGVKNTGPIPLQDRASFSRPPDDMVAAAGSLEVGAVFPEVYEKAGAYWVGRLAQRTEPDEADFESQREQLRNVALQQRQQSLFNGWLADVKERAIIVR